MSMHAFIVNSAYPKTAQNSDTLIITETTVENIRNIPEFLSKKPLKEKFNKVFIENAHNLSTVAQNALLKTLEDPPGSSEIYLVTDYPDQLLPTILSRAQVIFVKSSEIYQKKDLESITTREELLEHLDYLEMSVHNSLLRPPLKLRGGSEGALYKLLSETRKYTKANCNLKLCINHLASRL